MGVSIKTLIRLQTLHHLGVLPAKGSMVEIGAQNLVCKGFEYVVEQFIEYFRKAAGLDGLGCERADVTRIADKGTMAELMELCGFEYLALDIFDAPNCQLFDLNLNDVPAELKGRFDIVTNFGTTEHVVNQYKAFTTIHELAKPNGLIYSDLPMGGYLNHGYFTYTPLFFHHMALANQYKVVIENYSFDPKPRQVGSHMEKCGYTGVFYNNTGIEFVFQKTQDQHFVLPLETGTSLGLNPELWGGEAPYRVISGVEEFQNQLSPEWTPFFRLRAMRQMLTALGPKAILAELRQFAGDWMSAKARRLAGRSG